MEIAAHIIDLRRVTSKDVVIGGFTLVGGVMTDDKTSNLRNH